MKQRETKSTKPKKHQIEVTSQKKTRNDSFAFIRAFPPQDSFAR